MRSPELYISTHFTQDELIPHTNGDTTTIREVYFPESSLLLGSKEKSARLDTYGIQVCHSLRIGAFNASGDPALYLSHDLPSKAVRTTGRAENAVKIMLENGFNQLNIADVIIPDLTVEFMKGKRQKLALQMLIAVDSLIDDAFSDSLSVETYSFDDERTTTNSGLSFGIHYSPTSNAILPVNYSPNLATSF